MISNTDDVNQEIENMIDLSLWESRSSAFHDFIKYYSFDIKNFVIISVLGFFLVTTALLGFGFYLWFLKGSNEHTQSRLLNILNGYLAAVCMTFSLALFIKILHHQRFTSAKIYEKNVPDDELMENEQISTQESYSHSELLSEFSYFLFHSRLFSTTSSQDCVLEAVSSGVTGLPSRLW